MSAAISAAQVNFDALGIPHRPSLLQIVAEDAESYVRDIVSKASILFRNSHSEQLTPFHINTLLSSFDRTQPLFGYSNSPSFLLSSICYENSEIYVVKDPSEDLQKTMSAPSSIKPREFSYGFQWFLTEGVPADISQKKETQKLPNGLSNSDIIRPSSVDPSTRSYSARQFVGDVLHNKHLSIYVKQINMLRDDTSHQRMVAIRFLRTDKDLQPLLPYFLQFIIGEISMHYNNPVLMDIIVSVARALAENEYLCISLFTHVFLRIVTTFLLSPDSSSNLAEEDCKLREEAAKLLGTLRQRCEDAYPDFRVSLFNLFTDTIFSENSTLASQFGAIAGIEKLGYGPVKRLMPHLPLYCRLIAKCKETRQQATYVALIKNVINRMIHLIQSQPEGMNQVVSASIAKIHKIDF